ncbi:MAG: hypothetical protein R3B60_00250 [Candidatus Paceibacterota bacterium]
MQPKKLEEYRFFQPIAWIICLSFAGFVGLLSLQLQTVVDDLQASNLNIEERLDKLEKEIYSN